MKCPRDNSELLEDTFIEQRVHRCGECSGYLISFDSFKSLSPDFEKTVIPKINQAIQHGVILKGDIACPKCSESLFVQNVNKNEIDFCAECKFFWLDPGELSTSLGYAEFHSDSFGPLLELLIYALGEVLSAALSAID